MPGHRSTTPDGTLCGGAVHSRGWGSRRITASESWKQATTEAMMSPLQLMYQVTDEAWMRMTHPGLMLEGRALLDLR